MTVGIGRPPGAFISCFADSIYGRISPITGLAKWRPLVIIKSAPSHRPGADGWERQHVGGSQLMTKSPPAMSERKPCHAVGVKTRISLLARFLLSLTPTRPPGKAATSTHEPFPAQRELFRQLMFSASEENGSRLAGPVIADITSSRFPLAVFLDASYSWVSAYRPNSGDKGCSQLRRAHLRG